MPYADKEKQLAYYRKYNDKRKNSRKAYNKRYRENNREKLRNMSNEWAKNNPLIVRSYVLKRRYGITTKEYDNLLEKQNECCAICGSHCSCFKKALHLDHDHKSGRIRGLLCTNCNTALGHLHEDIYLLQKSIEKDTLIFNANNKKGISKFRNDINLLQKALVYLNDAL